MSDHAWIEVNLGALQHNFRQLQGAFGPARVIPVVKGNAYGHGIEHAGPALEAAGAEALAVTFVEEAAALRDAECKAPIWLLSPVRGSDDLQDAVEMGVTACVTEVEGARALAQAAAAQDKRLDVQIKIDSGMGRLGVRPDGAADLARAVAREASLRLTGVYSHCAEGRSAPAVARQLAVFQESCREIEAAGISVPMRHIAASAAALSLPESRLDAVRVGTLLYGQFPAPGLRQTPDGKELSLQETWVFKARILQIRSLPPGTSVGYGAEFQTSRVSRIAVVSAGLSDGLGMQPVSLGHKGLKGVLRSLAHGAKIEAAVRGQKAPVVGRVGMQLCSVDVTEILEAAVGDEVILPVRRIASSAALSRVFHFD